MQAQVPLKSGWYALLAPLALVSEMHPSGEALFEFLRQLGPTGQVQAAQSRGPAQPTSTKASHQRQTADSTFDATLVSGICCSEMNQTKLPAVRLLLACNHP